MDREVDTRKPRWVPRDAAERHRRLADECQIAGNIPGRNSHLVAAARRYRSEGFHAMAAWCEVYMENQWTYT